MTLVWPQAVYPADMTSSEIFQAMVKDGKKAEAVMFRYFTEVQGLVLRYTADEVCRTGRDLGDFLAAVPDLRMIQVKHNMDYDFRSFDNYRTNRIFIDSYWHACEKRYPYPLCGYAIPNASLTGFFWVPADLKHTWFKTEPVYNSKTREPEIKAAMPREYLKDMYFSIERCERIPWIYLYLK